MHRLLAWMTTLAFLAALPILLALCFTISIIGTKKGRTRNGVMQTPIRHYQHPQTGRIVILVGVIHVGRKSYYQSIQKLIDTKANQGYRILYEGVGKLTPEDIAKLPPDQRAIVEQMLGVPLVMNELVNILGETDFSFQKNGLEYPDWWIRTDMELNEVAQLFTIAGINFWDNLSPKKVRRVFKKIAKSKSSSFRKFFLTLLKYGPGIYTLYAIRAHFNQNKKAFHEIVITKRDAVAAAGILTHTEHTHVLSIWGAGHVPGIERHLFENGYLLMATEWKDAI